MSETAIRIGIDALAWKHKTGYGRYCRELISALLATPTRYSFTLLMDSDTCAPVGAEVVRFASHGHVRGSSGRALNELLRLIWSISRAPVDAWFFPSPLTFAPVVSRARVLIAIHDTIPWRYPGLIFRHRAQQLAWRLKLALAIQQAARVITVSEHARESLIQYLRIPARVIRIVGEAPAAAFQPNLNPAESSRLPDRLGIPPQARVIVYHGAFLPHKDLGTLVAAFARLCEEPQFNDVLLVLAGSESGFDRAEFHSVEKKCRELGRVKFPGTLADGDLALLLNRATVAVLPSLDEGFGLTGLEAVACGVPLIATRSSALPEVLGDAAWYFEPGDEAGLYTQLACLLADRALNRVLRERALECIAGLSWKTEARRLIEVFDEVLGAGETPRAGGASR
jgi:glycosyltransferase involved in cell wall biosynthesis